MSSHRNPIKKSRYLLEYACVLCVYHAVRILPLGMLRSLACISGFFLYHFPPAGRLIRANIKVALPEKTPREIRRIARKNASFTALLGLELLWFSGRPELLRPILTVAPEVSRLVDECRKSGRGLIWVSPHLGNWELARIVMDIMEVRTAVVVRPLNNPYLDGIVSGARNTGNVTAIPAAGAVKGMMKALKSGMVVATLIDQNTRVREGGVFIDFFGLPASSSRAPAMFARKMNALLGVGGVIREGKTYKTFMRPMPDDVLKCPDDEKIISELMAVTEDFIRQYPEQYLWMYERWRYIPENAGEETKRRYPYYATVATPRFYDDRAPKDNVSAKRAG